MYDRRDLAEVRRDLAAWLGKWQAKYAKLCSWVEDNIEETLTYYRLPRKCPKLCVPAARGLAACGVSALTPQADRRTVSQTGSARQSIRGSIASTPS